ncbi:MAG: serine hydrolase, partial [Gammaproteobacteria bacterium]|nr:serine hydrolase [Gammaproteobacteria bacterium]
FVIGPELAPRLTVGYVNRGDGNPDPEQPTREHTGRGYKVPNGGVYSTVGDLARFMGALQGRASPAILSDESVAEMTRVQTPEDADNGYGLGVMIRTTDYGARLIGHSGSVAGYNAYMLFEPESGLGVVLLRNYNQGEASLGAAGQQLLVELLAALR